MLPRRTRRTTRRRPRALGLLASLFLIAPFLWVASADEACAQSALRRGQGTMKRGAQSMSRSAGTLSRSSGTRRGNALSRNKAGSSEAMPSERRAASSDFRSTTEPSGEDRSGTDGELEANAAISVTKDGASAPGDSDDADYTGKTDYGARTLGKACMYGVRGEVIYRPRGARCRGDVVPPPTVSPAAAAPTSTPVARRVEATSPTPRPRALGTQTRPNAQSRQAGPSRRRGRGCIYGREGQILHAPAGSNCP